MAGNIIPAIATTNAIIAALIVMEGLKILQGQMDQCKTVSTWLGLHLFINSLAPERRWSDIKNTIFKLIILISSLGNRI